MSDLCLRKAWACAAAAWAFVAAAWAVEAAVLIAPPSRLAVFLLHRTVSLLKTEFANSLKLVLVCAYLLPG
jgi:hypothetical protein